MWRLELGTPKTGQTAFAIWPVVFRGAGDGNRTRVMSLEGSGSTIEPRPHVMHTLAQAGGVRRALRKSAARRKCRKRGRDDRIRTCDVLPPKQARYQTAPRPDLMRHELYRNGAPSNPAPEPRPDPKALKAHGALGCGRTRKALGERQAARAVRFPRRKRIAQQAARLRSRHRAARRRAPPFRRPVGTCRQRACAARYETTFTGCSQAATRAMFSQAVRCAR